LLEALGLSLFREATRFVGTGPGTCFCSFCGLLRAELGQFAEFDSPTTQFFSLLVGDPLAVDDRFTCRGPRLFRQRSGAVALSQGQLTGLSLSNFLSFTNLDSDLSAIGLGYSGLMRRFLGHPACTSSLFTCNDALLPHHGFGPRVLLLPCPFPLLCTLPSPLTCLLLFWVALGLRWL